MEISTAPLALYAYSCSESGDLLVIYTDGTTEAMNAGNDEFGEARLLETLRANCGRESRAVLRALVHAVQQFSGGEQNGRWFAARL